ncbi:hypothetical protein [Pseudomonas asplenii]|uniref:hypothetical protein n=1 Tax=Pseudomonas asplenii TaxID=53407 RepID=UPI00235F4BB0|nr:hypothetical protein [Pseudomonas asplenii]
MTTDYQTLLQLYALRFLQRHQCQHLSSDRKLIDRAVDFLVNDYDLQAPAAHRIVELAMADLNDIRDRQQLDRATSSTTHSVIVDPETGEAWAIPVALIYERIACGPDGSRFRVANS